MKSANPSSRSIRTTEGKRLVTSIEILSLSNRCPASTVRPLPTQAEEILASQVHLIEVDFLRGGEHTTAVPLDLAREACAPFDYHVSVRPFDDLETFLVYPIQLADRLPPIDIPLLPGDPSVTLDLQAVFDRCYDAGPYSREIQYGKDTLIPPLRPDQAAWAAAILQATHG